MLNIVAINAFAINSKNDVGIHRLYSPSNRMYMITKINKLLPKVANTKKKGDKVTSINSYFYLSP